MADNEKTQGTNHIPPQQDIEEQMVIRCLVREMHHARTWNDIMEIFHAICNVRREAEDLRLERHRHTAGLSTAAASARAASRYSGNREHFDPYFTKKA